MANFCSKCGNVLKDNAQICDACGQSVQPVINQTIINNYNQPKVIIKSRSIGLAVLLTILTCGIYGIFWFISMTDESNSLSDKKHTSGGIALLLTLITCNIYGIYWNYKMGEKMFDIGKKYNKQISNNSVLYLILSLFGLGLVNYCLIQSDLNKFANE
jgi:hypothetical protein